MEFSKNDLASDHYSWPQSSVVTADSAVPGRRKFDKTNGNQVLRIINFLGKDVGSMTVSDFRRLEDIIFKKLPEGDMSEMSVFNWLRIAYLY